MPAAALWPLHVIGPLLVVAVAGALACYRLIRVKPKVRADVSGTRIEVYVMPGWKLRRLKSDALIAFSDQTGWIGYGTTKYIRDKADFGLDDLIEGAAPIPVGRALSFPVRRLPARFLVVANIFDERKLTSRAQFAAGFDAGMHEAARRDCFSILVMDPTDEWNYFEHRADASLAAEMLIEGIVRHRDRVRVAKILVTSPENLRAFAEALTGIEHQRSA